MPDEPYTKPDEIAPLLRLGLEDEADSAAMTLDATIRVDAPTPRTGGGATGGSSYRGWEPPSVEELQQVLPQYEISGFIARGGMGAVYKGLQRALKRPVAIKVLPPEMAAGDDLNFADRFKREAQAMARLSHPNIVAVFDAGETPDGLLYFVMEFIEGTDVAQLIASEGKLDAARATSIISAVCEALAFAHEEGIVHRDIKPSNIMIDKRGRVKVADFGLAKVTSADANASLVTQSNVAMGTPDFIAPEALIPGISVDGRADLYAVGVMLYQMLTGKIPRGRFELPSGVVPQVDKGFDAIVDRAMQTDRDKRYSTATEMKKDVESVEARSGGFQPPGPEVAAVGNRRSLMKSRTLPILIAAAVVVLGGGAFFLINEPMKPENTAAAAPPSSAWTRVNLEALAQEDDTYRQEAGGWFRMSGRRTFTPFSSTVTNVGLRVEFGGSLQHNKMPEILLREQASQNFNAYLDGDGQKLVIQRYDGTQPLDDARRYKTLGELLLPVPVRPGAPYTLEFLAVGSRLIARLNGATLEVAAPDPPTSGLATLYNPDFDTYRKVEFINLDGLSEAEALKAAGTDTPAAAKQPRWETFDFSKMDEKTFADAFSGAAKLKGGLLHSTNYDICGWNGVRARNVALRTTLPVDANMADARLINSVGTTQTGVRLWRSSLEIFVNRSGQEKVYQRFKLVPELTRGGDAVLQMAIIGKRVFAWLDGRFLGDAEVEGMSEEVGRSNINAQSAFFRSFEVLNLDGLSEAEALKAAGVDGALPSQTSASWIAVDLAAAPTNPKITLNGRQLQVSNGQWRPLESKRFRQVAQRITFVWRENTANVKLITGNDSAAVHYGKLGASRSGGQFWEVGHYSGHDQRLDGSKPDIQPPLKPGDTAVFQFATLGDRHFVWLNGKLLGSATHPATAGGGGLSVYADELLLDRYEYMSLDGLSDAEARKAAGLDAVSASPTLPVPASNASRSDAGGSKPSAAPLPQPGPDGRMVFPVGVWAQMKDLTKHEKTEDGPWVRLGQVVNGWYEKDIVLMTNLGIRARFRGQRVKDYDYPQLNLRGVKDKTPALNLHIRSGKMQIRVMETGFPVLAEAPLREPLPAGKEYVAELYAIGQQVIARVNGQVLTASTDLPPAPCSFSLFGADWDYFKDAQVLNLDGLSEAEARKAAGIGE